MFTEVFALVITPTLFTCMYMSTTTYDKTCDSTTVVTVQTHSRNET